MRGVPRLEVEREQGERNGLLVEFGVSVVSGMHLDAFPGYTAKGMPWSAMGLGADRCGHEGGCQ